MTNKTSEFNKVFTLDALSNDQCTQEAVKALLEFGSDQYRPKGACSEYDRLVGAASRASTVKEFQAIVSVAAHEHPAYFEEFLWNLENLPMLLSWQEWEDSDNEETDEGRFHEEQEQILLWGFLLDDIVVEDGYAYVPDLGHKVELNGRSFQQHSTEVGEEFSGNSVMLFDRCPGGWAELGANGWTTAPLAVNKEAHYYCMAVPVVGHEPRWDKWCFAPNMANAPVVRYNDLLEGVEDSRYEWWASEPPIRAAVASLAKKVYYEGHA